MNTNSADSKENISKISPGKILSSGKDLVALLRDGLIFILAVMLLFLPERLNKTLVKAGFKEGNIAGFKWEAGIAQYDVTLKESQATITNLKAQLDSTSKVLAEAQLKTSDPELKQKLEKVEEENKAVKESSSKSQENARKTIYTNIDLVETAQVAVNTGDEWGVVFSGDNNLKQAKYEIDLAKKRHKIPNANVYYRQGMFRSVAVVNSRAKAEEILSAVKLRSKDAYIVPMTTWCKNTNEKDGYIVCNQ